MRLPNAALKLSVLFVALIVPMCANSQVINGEFTDNGAGWTVNQVPAVPPWDFGDTFATTNCHAEECITGSGGDVSGIASLSQEIDNSGDGPPFSLSFEFATDGGPMELEVLFGDTVVMDLVDIGPTPLTTYVIPDVIPTGGFLLQFVGFQEFDSNELTGVSLVSDNGSGPPGVTPEPSSLALFGTGAFCLAVLVRYRLRHS